MISGRPRMELHERPASSEGEISSLCGFHNGRHDLGIAVVVPSLADISPKLILNKWKYNEIRTKMTPNSRQLSRNKKRHIEITILIRFIENEMRANSHGLFYFIFIYFILN